MTETPQEVIARATASGLLDGIQPTQPMKKEGRGRQTRKGPGHQSRQRPHVSVSGQSQVAEFLNREMKANSSAPTAAQERTNDTQPPWGNTLHHTHLTADPLSLSCLIEYYL